jgi:hypothetical protein
MTANQRPTKAERHAQRAFDALTEQKRNGWGKGLSKSAAGRRADRGARFGRLLGGMPGDTITASRGATYMVAADGSLQRTA